MRSQVQVLAGPPPIVAGQRAVGSELGALVGCLGRAGAARPSAPASPSAPLGPSTRPSGSTTTTHRGRPPSPRAAATQPVRQLRGAAGSRAPRSRQRWALRTPIWPGWPGSGQAAAARTQPGPGPPPTPLTTRDLGSVARFRACSVLDRAARRRGSPPGPRPVPVVQVARRTGPVPTATACRGTRRTRPDGWGGRQTAGRWTGGQQTAGPPDPGRRTKVSGERTGWTPDGWTAGPRTTNPG